MPFALQNKALFKGEKRAKRCSEKGRKRGGQQRGQKEKRMRENRSDNDAKKSKLLRCGVFTTPSAFTLNWPLLTGEKPCKTQQKGASSSLKVRLLKRETLSKHKHRAVNPGPRDPPVLKLLQNNNRESIGTGSKIRYVDNTTESQICLFSWGHEARQQYR